MIQIAEVKYYFYRTPIIFSIFFQHVIINLYYMLDGSKLPGYRSPLRHVPDEVIPEPAFHFNLCGDTDCQGPTNPGDKERYIDSCRKEEWWHEAIKVAEQVEGIQKALDLTQMVSVTFSCLVTILLYLLADGIVCSNESSSVVTLSILKLSYWQRVPQSPTERTSSPFFFNL